MSTIVVTPVFGSRTTRPVARPMARRVAAPAAVRLTRRGRLVLTVLFLGLALVALTVLGPTSAATGEAGTPEPTRTVMVQQGDTLWGIASSVAAPGEVREMVHHIEQLNALSGAGVYVGQEIAVPVGR
ncbi:LysM peptidoglycan-binding domain-containing protein [Nocardioides mesophilus]|uniref:LysM peptidoglycan-binding domain-containing protein n=1 Tax=Nocardioides mesophilus TaxID=433659 RepID=A0A7G9R9K6_9ACTN|nr:LysM peptidoglycan-binding domain-containing protein [Nocardioides mesophilus]QNN52281.1 LysM peptidoglycan-binding domain-containing protein [Nocardioides mesophilus]